MSTTRNRILTALAALTLTAVAACGGSGVSEEAEPDSIGETLVLVNFEPETYTDLAPVIAGYFEVDEDSELGEYTGNCSVTHTSSQQWSADPGTVRARVAMTQETPEDRLGLEERSATPLDESGAWDVAVQEDGWFGFGVRVRGRVLTVEIDWAEGAGDAGAPEDARRLAERIRDAVLVEEDEVETET